MPPSKPVQSLYFQCLNCVYESLHQLLTNGISFSNFERLRNYYARNLHGGIREHILKLALLKKEQDYYDLEPPDKDRNRIKFLLNLIDLLADQSISHLSTISKHRLLFPEHYSSIITSLSKRDCVGLKSLRLRVHYDPPDEIELDPVLKTNSNFFHSLLARGLARNLTVLQLIKCCDNKILKIVGRHCNCLTKLDITGSWAVDDYGFKNLCLKFPEKMPNFSDSECYRPQRILDMMSMKPDLLNPCCITLYDVKIQETNTSNMTVLMLLIFIKNLRTVGGFIYFRNVGDNIFYLAELARGRFQLKLNELFDTNLTDQKVQQLTIVAPQITAMYTRSIFVHPVLSKFKQLSDITIDFDYQPYEDNFYKFLTVSGGQLKRINLISKSGFLDIIRIFKLCPNLHEIRGSVIVYDISKELPICTLKKANLKIMEASTIPWLMCNAPNLECLKIFAYTRRMDLSQRHPTFFDNKLLKSIIKMKPACLGSLKYFIVFATFSETFSRKTILKFILACKALQFIGDLATWTLNEKEFLQIKKQIEYRNLDVKILYDSILPSEVTMQNIKG